MPSDAATRYRRYRAPRSDNSVVAVPLLSEVRTALDPAIDDLQLGDLNLRQLRSTARRELLTASIDYSCQYLSIEQPTNGDCPLFLTGHQAELFHPGVWFKNFALSELANRHAGVGIHLVIDTDTVHSNSIRVPGGSSKAPTIKRVQLDTPAAALPVEERRVRDHALFNSFGERTTEAIAPLIKDPLVKEWWPRVTEAAQRTGGNGHLAITQARHQLEQTWGANTLELPMSRACELSVFAPFVAGLLSQAPRVWRAYNEALKAYRMAHRLRTEAQPMPDLAREGEWLEMPFWIWTAANPERRPLFVRLSGDDIQLTNHADWNTTISSDPSQATEHLRDIAATGWKLRTRALTTTLYARLVLGDVFLHGIGGAKYDEVTDDWARRLWGIEPPPYMALSATVHLPIKHESVTDEDVRKVQQSHRNWHWHPEKWLDENPTAAAKAAWNEKQHWIATTKTPTNAANRHRKISIANQTLRHETDEVRRELERRKSELMDKLRASQILDSREYAFCLFPEQDLRQRMWKLLGD